MVVSDIPRRKCRKKRLPGKFKSYLLYGPSACCSTQQPGDVAEMPRTPGQSAEIDDGEIGVETEQCPDAEMPHTPGQSAEINDGDIGVETEWCPDAEMLHTAGQSAEIDDREIGVETAQCPDVEMSQIPDCGLGNNSLISCIESAHYAVGLDLRDGHFSASCGALGNCLNLYGSETQVYTVHCPDTEILQNPDQSADACGGETRVETDIVRRTSEIPEANGEADLLSSDGPAPSGVAGMEPATSVLLSTDGQTDMELKEGQKRCRKTVRCPKKWKKNKAKLARQHGQAYENSKGISIPAKVAPVSATLCGGKCRLKCSDISEKDRTSLHSAFYDLDESGKNVYLFGCIHAYTPKCSSNTSGRNRSWSYAYNVLIDGCRRRVCRRALCNLHSISASKIRHLNAQVAAGHPTAPPILRGKHENRPNKVDEELIRKVKEHIESFPSELSHYSRTKNPHRRYLSALLTVNKMYQMYKTQCEEHNTKPVSAAFYRNVFNSEFNLGFGSPRSDTCATCDKADGDVSEHIQKANAAFEVQKNDRLKAENEDGVHYISFDLQKTLPLPKLSTSTAFYLRQIWLYNLGIHLVSGKESRGYFQIWTESEAGRGCEEISSSLLAFLDSSHLSGNGHLIAWSDSCAGQNKNFLIVCFWQLLVSLHRFSVVDHKFPEPGHSFLDSDRDFAQVERSVRKYENIYSVDQYHDIMRSCVHKSPFVVNRMTDRFFNFKELPKMLGLKQPKKNTDGERIEFRDGIRWIRTETFGEYKYKHTLTDEEPWKTVKLRVGAEDMDHVAPVVDLVTLARPAGEHRAINKKKIDDIKKQLVHIPITYRAFYLSLAADSAVDMESEESHDSDLENTSSSHAPKVATHCRETNHRPTKRNLALQLPMKEIGASNTKRAKKSYISPLHGSDLENTSSSHAQKVAAHRRDTNRRPMTRNRALQLPTKDIPATNTKRVTKRSGQEQRTGK